MFLMKDNKITPAQVKVSSSKSYTLDELEQLAREFCDYIEVDDGTLTRTDVRLCLSLMIAWARKREKEWEMALQVNDNLPTWSDCEAKVDDKMATALEQFIYDHEPSDSHGGKEWRRQLAAVIREART